jgi:transposase-like protein
MDDDIAQPTGADDIGPTSLPFSPAGNAAELLARNEEIRRLHEAGARVSALAARFGMHRAAVRAVLKRMGAPLRTRGNPVRDERIRELSLAGGMTLAAIGQDVGVCAAYVLRIVRRLGVHKPKLKRDLMPVHAVLATYRGGRSLRQTAREFGCSPQTVARILVDLGEPIRPPSGGGRK